MQNLAAWKGELVARRVDAFKRKRQLCLYHDKEGLVIPIDPGSPVVEGDIVELIILPISIRKPEPDAKS